MLGRGDTHSLQKEQKEQVEMIIADERLKIKGVEM